MSHTNRLPSGAVREWVEGLTTSRIGNEQSATG
jgi:hypothetical protein